MFVLPAGAGAALVDAREKGPDQIRQTAGRPGTMCGHAGDGNIHLGVFEQDADRRDALMNDLLSAGISLGGAFSAEHGVGHATKKYLEKLEDPTRLALMRSIKQTFGPERILNPGVLFD